MSVVPSPRFYEILPPEKEETGKAGFRINEPEWFEEPADGEHRAGLRGRVVTLLLVGSAAATIGWQTSYGHATRETIASLSPNLSWVAPEQTTPERIEQITRSVEQMASDIAASHEQLTRSIDHLAAGQEQMNREIIRLRALSYAAGQPGEGLRRIGRHSR
ncbi:MAG: hypothetical protein J2P53_16220 [Bradyrhizobiaceae bacterium]|nr:hypothetical protein [Bradyrhizobiaceae bacterium]